MTSRAALHDPDADPNRTSNPGSSGADADRDPGLFGPESVTWRIHGDPAMLLGGFRALLLQAVHPLVMAGFEANSAYRADPWGRLQRTGLWIATVTFGTTTAAEAAGVRLRAIHAAMAEGIEPESGLPYRVDDPDLLLWVHCTEVDSFLSTYQRSGGRLARGDGDRYVDEMRESARLVGLDPAGVPADTGELRAYLREVRPQLRVTDVARRGALWGFAPPMPLWVQMATPARPAWAALVANAAGLLPRWARRLYGLPGLPTTDLAAVAGARAVRATLLAVPERWAGSPARRDALRRLASTGSQRGRLGEGQGGGEGGRGDVAATRDDRDPLSRNGIRP